MNENLKLLFEKIGEDSELLAKLQTITDPDEAYELLSNVQGGYTKEEFVDAMKQIQEIQTANNGDLSDEDLEKLAGGISWEESVSYTVTAAVSGAAGGVGAVIAAHAAAGAAAI